MKAGARGVIVVAVNTERLILRIALATELGAGVLLGMGLFTPPAGVFLVTITATLVVVSWPHEYPLYLLFVAVAISLSGGTGTLGVGFGLAGAVSLEGLRQLSGQRAATGAWRGLGRGDDAAGTRGGMRAE
jgi:uncharacterized membrane protein YphA (DoxX/SURF4 family)